MTGWGGESATVVNTAALKAAEPRLSWLSEQLRKVAVHLDPADAPVTSGGVLLGIGENGGPDLMDAAVDLVLAARRSLNEISDTIVAVRHKFEKAEDDSTVLVGELFAELAEGLPSPGIDWPPDLFPRDKPKVEFPDSPDGTPKMPDLPDVRGLLGEPQRDGSSAVSEPPARAVRDWPTPATSVGSGGLTGVMVGAFAYPYTPTEMSDTILGWTVGVDSGATNFWAHPAWAGEVFRGAADAMLAIADAVEVVFTYVRWMWHSASAWAAEVVFKATVSRLSDLSEALGKVAECEHGVAEHLRAADREAVDRISRLDADYASYYDLTLSISGSGSGIGTIFESLELKLRAAQYANQFAKTGRFMMWDHGYRCLDLRRDARQALVDEGCDLPEVPDPDLSSFPG